MCSFCFIMYYFRENQQKTGDIYFFIGIVIILISIYCFLFYITELIDKNSVIIDGLWTTRKVKINIDHLVGVKRVNTVNLYSIVQFTICILIKK